MNLVRHTGASCHCWAVEAEPYWGGRGGGGWGHVMVGVVVVSLYCCVSVLYSGCSVCCSVPSHLSHSPQSCLACCPHTELCQLSLSVSSSESVCSLSRAVTTQRASPACPLTPHITLRPADIYIQRLSHTLPPQQISPNY